MLIPILLLASVLAPVWNAPGHTVALVDPVSIPATPLKGPWTFPAAPPIPLRKPPVVSDVEPLAEEEEPSLVPAGSVPFKARR